MNDNSIVNLADRAHACLASGQLDEAKSLYSRLCHLDANNEENWLTLAALIGETGELDEALTCANKAIELDDTYVEAYLTRAHLLQRDGKSEEAFESALAAVQRDDTYDEAMMFLTGLAGQMKRFEDAEHWAQKTIALLPADVDALLNLASATYELTKYQEAEKTYKQVLELNPHNQQAILGLAKSIDAQGRHDEAITLLEPLVSSAPGNYHAKDALAACLINLERDDEAFDILAKLIKSRPDYVFSYIHIAGIAERRGDYLQAINYLNQALENTSEQLEVLGVLARLYHEYGMHQQAIESCEKAMEIDPGNRTAQYFRALALSDLAHYEDALKELDTLALDDPDSTQILGAKASLLERLGKYDEAHQIIKSLITHDTIPGSIIGAYARLCHKFSECDQAIALINETLNSSGLNKEYHRGLLFSLGKLHDRLHNYEAAFIAIKQANDLKPYIYDHTRYTDYINRLISPEVTTLANLPRIINSLRRIRPVFIVGMPRSGTSLVEQIISSHPQVVAGGERHEISSLVNKLPYMEGVGGTYPECLAKLTPSLIDQILIAYDSFTKDLPPDATVLTDKMPENFHHIVFIRMLFPDARIIHCVRDPMDTCLSCYFQQFTGYHDYAYKLEDLGKHYNEYKRLMNYYKNEANIPYFEVRYEDLVQNTEELSRKMIDYCNLEWDDQCLRFYESDRVVRTASYDQVNKPIYSSSIGRWKHYETHLQPLRDALGGSK